MTERKEHWMVATITTDLLRVHRSLRIESTQRINAFVCGEGEVMTVKSKNDSPHGFEDLVLSIGR